MRSMAAVAACISVGLFRIPRNRIQEAGVQSGALQGCVQVVDQPLAVPGIAAGQVEKIGDMVGTEDGLLRVEGGDQFSRLRVRLDGCLTGSQLAKDRAAEALTKVMIPEALDYPA